LPTSPRNTRRSTVTGIQSYCAECDREQQFEQPECVDDHGGDCPDWACVVCGSAIVTGLFPLELVGAGERRVA
jgi:hypothetical protein